ncbi:hypothetical protein [Tenacibaculum larymnensis]|uniref:GAPS4b N-terminal domain-containing protein n=1 Tax=Tenacibaculum larymnensis TaxID=2878201 RepID=A0A9X4ET89_9FLAO|nr:hypothetical protein [Tenacibaculum larymnensis]MDE1206026.1 hypothetical protein [Tenacibaculum larymnensis]
MGGQEGLRGYIIQTIVAVIESLDDRESWEKVTLEPNEKLEKVDILWNYANNKNIAVQVKSSKNNIEFSNASKWIEELKKDMPSASEYQLYLVGSLQNKLKTELKQSNNIINGATVKVRALEYDSLNALIVEKIDSFLHKRNKENIDINVRKIMSTALKNIFIENSLKGKEFSKKELEEALINVILDIKKQAEKHLYSYLKKEANNYTESFDTEHLVIANFLSLIGWDNFNYKQMYSEYNDRTGKDDEFIIDFCSLDEDKLKDNNLNYIYIQSLVVNSYADIDKKKIVQLYQALGKVSEGFEKKHTDSEEKTYSKNVIHFLLSKEINEDKETFRHKVRSFDSKKHTLKDYIYYTIDNKQLYFLYRSIITAKTYRPETSIKFLYPQTEDIVSEGKIGKRAQYLPPQFLTSSVLPIVKENKDKISVLIFCNDTYSPVNLKKIVWLTISITSGFANEYLIYFPEYIENNETKNEVRDILRTFNDNLLLDKVSVHRLSEIDSNFVKDQPLYANNDSSINELVDESQLKQVNYKPNSDFLNNYLPYGSLIKPFLNSDRIKSDDLRDFLAKEKGIHFRSSDKTKIIGTMTKILFSPSDVENLTKLVLSKRVYSKEVPKRPYVTLEIIETKALESVIKKSIPDIKHNINEKLKSKDAKLIDVQTKTQSDNVILEIFIEEYDPNKQAMLSKIQSVEKVVFTNKGNSIEPIQLFQTTLGGQLTKSSLTFIENNLKERKIIKKITNEIMFKDFTSNEERVLFLLSFTDITNHVVFQNVDLVASSYALDETMSIPEELNDKAGKNIVTSIRGKKLHEINELKDENIRKYILLEKIKVLYTFNHKQLEVSGKMEVEINFSGALKNKPEPDGRLSLKFKITPHKSSSMNITNLQSFESNLKKIFYAFQKGKLKEFEKL